MCCDFEYNFIKRISVFILIIGYLFLACDYQNLSQYPLKSAKFIQRHIHFDMCMQPVRLCIPKKLLGQTGDKCNTAGKL